MWHTCGIDARGGTFQQGTFKQGSFEVGFLTLHTHEGIDAICLQASKQAICLQTAASGMRAVGRGYPQTWEFRQIVEILRMQTPFAFNCTYVLWAKRATRPDKLVKHVNVKKVKASHMRGNQRQVKREAMTDKLHGALASASLCKLFNMTFFISVGGAQI